MKEKIAYLGPAGTFCEEAAMALAADMGPVSFVAFSCLEEVVQSVEDGDVQKGVLPLENSREGSVGLTLDLLSEARVTKIRGEVIIPVTHYLFAPPGIQGKDILEVHSHPQALAQCRPFLQAHFKGVTEVPEHSTAGAVDTVASLGGRRGALGPKRSGQIYGLEMLSVATPPEFANQTRFVLLGREDAPPTGNDKTSLLFSVEAGPGRLYRILELFANHDINLTKIESRPAKKDLGEYIFFLDFEGHRKESRLQDILKGISDRVPFLKILGSYPICCKV